MLNLASRSQCAQLERAGHSACGPCAAQQCIPVSRGLRAPRRAARARPSLTVSASPSPSQSPEEAEQLAKIGWDPDGLFKNAPPANPGSGDLFAQREERRRQQRAREAVERAQEQDRQEQQQKQQQQQEQQQGSGSGSSSSIPPGTPHSPFLPIPPAQAEAGGVPGSSESFGPFSRAEYSDFLARSFMPVNLDMPGLRVHHLDPPVLTVEGFLGADSCRAIMDASAATGCMRESKIGSDNADTSAGVNAYDARRTSSSMLLDNTIQSQKPTLRKLVKGFQQHVRKLLDHTEGSKMWGKPGYMPKGGQYCYESPQVACYQPTQHFLSHEDAFPVPLARANQFQRHATVLIYLNSVDQGGSTCFDHLGVCVQPQQGKALLFFPAFSDSRPDPRTLHTAVDAQDTKWVMQQWVARGFQPR